MQNLAYVSPKFVGNEFSDILANYMSSTAHTIRMFSGYETVVAQGIALEIL
jgi:hypothetical protein